jgi:hypothetical protein
MGMSMSCPRTSLLDIRARGIGRVRDAARRVDGRW